MSLLSTSQETDKLGVVEMLYHVVTLLWLANTNRAHFRKFVGRQTGFTGKTAFLWHHHTRPAVANISGFNWEHRIFRYITQYITRYLYNKETPYKHLGFNSVAALARISSYIEQRVAGISQFQLFDTIFTFLCTFYFRNRIFKPFCLHFIVTRLTWASHNWSGINVLTT